MSELTPLVGAHHGAFFIMDGDGGDGPVLRLIASYAYKERKHVATASAPARGWWGSRRWRRSRSC
jgi:hypothetical protein